jgi:hypothetical protein
MSDERRMSRRRFLLWSAGLGGALWVSSNRGWALLPWIDRQSLLSRRLAALLEHQESAKSIGRAYLQRYPQEAAIGVLHNQIVSSLASDAAALILTQDSDLKDQLDRAVRQDFEVEKIVKLHGWILSLTEARLCALTALL